VPHHRGGGGGGGLVFCPTRHVLKLSVVKLRTFLKKNEVSCCTRRQGDLGEDHIRCFGKTPYQLVVSVA